MLGDGGEASGLCAEVVEHGRLGAGFVGSGTGCRVVKLGFEFGDAPAQARCLLGGGGELPVCGGVRLRPRVETLDFGMKLVGLLLQFGGAVVGGLGGGALGIQRPGGLAGGAA